MTKKKAGKKANPARYGRPTLIGNQFWLRRSKSGRSPVFETADDLWDECIQYLEWVSENPLITTELVKFQGKATQVEVPKMRAATITGLCDYLGIAIQTWGDYRKKGDDFLAVITRVDQVIRTQKFEGAAAELLNPNIIARDLGLSDKSQHTTMDEDGREVGLSPVVILPSNGREVQSDGR